MLDHRTQVQTGNICVCIAMGLFMIFMTFIGTVTWITFSHLKATKEDAGGIFQVDRPVTYTEEDRYDRAVVTVELTNIPIYVRHQCSPNRWFEQSFVPVQLVPVRLGGEEYWIGQCPHCLRIIYLLRNGEGAERSR